MNVRHEESKDFVNCSFVLEKQLWVRGLKLVGGQRGIITSCSRGYF